MGTKIKVETKEAAPVSGKPWTRHYDPDVPASLVYPSVPLQAMLDDAAERFKGLAVSIHYHANARVEGHSSKVLEPGHAHTLEVAAQRNLSHFVTGYAKSQLGEILTAQGRHADAEPLLLAGYEGLQQREAKIPAPGKARLTEALERLVQLYEATGKKDQADAWRKKLEETKAVAKPPAQP